MDGVKPCDGKSWWRTRKQAEKALERIRNDRNRTIQVPRYAFLCPHCDRFHLSSNPRKEDVDVVLKALGLEAS
jgi:hypothetical protein